MKTLTILSLLLLWLSSNLDAQIPDNHAVAFIKLINPDNSIYANKTVVLKSKKGAKPQEGKTDATGQVKFFVPINDTYTIHCGDKTCQKTLVITAPYVTHQINSYTHPHLYYTLTYVNKQNKPIVNEDIVVKSLTSTDFYRQTTDAEGKAIFDLPPTGDYRVSSKYVSEIAIVKTTVGQEHAYYNSTRIGIGKLEKENQDLTRLREDNLRLEDEKAQKLEEERWAEEARIEDSTKLADFKKPSATDNIIFFAKSTKKTFVGGITIYDGGRKGKAIGVLNSVWSCSNGPSCAKAEVTTKKPFGKYKYYAVAGNGRTWEGEYEIKEINEYRIMLPID